jgi:hypothetical protein
MSTFMDHIHRLDQSTMHAVPDVGTCPACGQAIDHCPGHGMIGDPCGYEALQRHDGGDHAICHPSGCEAAALLARIEKRRAYDADFDRVICRGEE